MTHQLLREERSDMQVLNAKYLSDPEEKKQMAL